MEETQSQIPFTQEQTQPQEEKEKEKEKEKKAKNQINIKVSNAEGMDTFFKIKTTTKLKKLMDAYCNRYGFAPGSVRFSFDGNRIDPNSTPDGLDMEDQDTIDVMTEQTGGFESNYFFCSSNNNNFFY